MKKLTIAIGCAAVLMAASAQAAVITVGGRCNLQRAIVSANNDASPQGFCTPGRGADIINIPAGRLVRLTQVNNVTPYGPTGLPVIRSQITINGNGSIVRRAPRSLAFGIIAVSPVGHLALRNITISGGVSRDRFGPSFGAGIQVEGGQLILDRATIMNNVGSGVGVSRGRAVINRSTLIHNGDFREDDGACSNRESGLESYGTVFVTNSTFSGNRCYGIYRNVGTLNVKDSTIAYNGATGIYAGDFRPEGLSFTRNIVAGNSAGGVQLDFDSESFGDCGVALVNRWNLLNQAGGDLCGDQGNIEVDLPAEEILSPQLVRGTHALVAGSPAIDAVSDGTGCSPTDQRGVVRPQDGNGDGGLACDIGAYEFVFSGSTVTPAPQPITQPQPVTQPQPESEDQPVTEETEAPIVEQVVEGGVVDISNF